MNFTNKKYQSQHNTAPIASWLVASLLFLPSFIVTAQENVDKYYLKTVSIACGSKVTYLAVREIYSSDPKQFIITDVTHEAIDSGAKFLT